MDGPRTAHPIPGQGVTKAPRPSPEGSGSTRSAPFRCGRRRWLKIPVGAFTAVMGVLAIEEGLDVGAGIPTTQGGILFLAFIFGYSQQLFTRMVDARGSRIRAGLAGPTQAEDPRRP